MIKKQWKLFLFLRVWDRRKAININNSNNKSHTQTESNRRLFFFSFDFFKLNFAKVNMPFTNAGFSQLIPLLPLWLFKWLEQRFFLGSHFLICHHYCLNCLIRFLLLVIAHCPKKSWHLQQKAVKQDWICFIVGNDLWHSLKWWWWWLINSNWL